MVSAGKAKKIMIVEDDETTSQYIKTLMESKGYELVCALSGFECLEKMAAAANMPDVILLDLMMPGMDGWQLLEKLREREECKGLPVIIVSAKDQPIDRILANEHFKVHGYITKPFDARELLEKIKSALGEK